MPRAIRDKEKAQACYDNLVHPIVKERNSNMEARIRNHGQNPTPNKLIKEFRQMLRTHAPPELERRVIQRIYAFFGM